MGRTSAGTMGEKKRCTIRVLTAASRSSWRVVDNWPWNGEEAPGPGLLMVEEVMRLMSIITLVLP